MKVALLSVHIPSMSTIGYGTGEVLDWPGHEIAEGEVYWVRFAGDHRPMRAMATQAQELEPEMLIVDLEDWQILEVRATDSPQVVQ